MLNTIKLGTLLLNGEPKKPCVVPEEDTKVLIGDTVSGMELEWIRLGDLLLAKNCVCTDVSWFWLDQLDLIYGRTITIDGKHYFCSSLSVGKEMGVPNEWDFYLDSIGYLPYQLTVPFWGKDAAKSDLTQPQRVVRGGDAARSWGFAYWESRYEDVGFRPILEPLDKRLQAPDLLNRQVRIRGTRSEITIGTLVDYDDYDVVLNDVVVASGSEYISKRGADIFVSRSNIAGIARLQAG